MTLKHIDDGKLKEDLHSYDAELLAKVDESDMDKVLDKYDEIQSKADEIHDKVVSIRELFCEYVQEVLGRKRTSIREAITVRDKSMYTYNSPIELPMYKILFGEVHSYMKDETLNYLDELTEQLEEECDDAEVDTFKTIASAIKSQLFVEVNKDYPRNSEITPKIEISKEFSDSKRLKLKMRTNSKFCMDYSYSRPTLYLYDGESHRMRDANITPRQELLELEPTHKDYYKKARVIDKAKEVYELQEKMISELDKHLDRLTDLHSKVMKETAAVVAAGNI